MRKIEPLEEKLTHKYVGEFDHLDEWREVGTYSILNSRLVEEGNGHDEVGLYAIRVRVDSDKSEDEVKAALNDAFTKWGCSHEYDCCGCLLLGVVKVKHAKRKEYVVVQRVGRNY
jgi:hypothetical protein